MTTAILEQVYSGKVKSIANRILRNKGLSYIDADDITQEVAISTLANGCDRQTGWVVKNAISREKAAKRGGRMQRQDIDTNDAGSDCNPLDRLIQAESIGSLSEAIERLPADLKKVVKLRFFDGMDFRQMAFEMTGNPKSVNGVVIKLKRAIELLSESVK